MRRRGSSSSGRPGRASRSSSCRRCRGARCRLSVRSLASGAGRSSSAATSPSATFPSMTLSVDDAPVVAQLGASCMAASARRGSGRAAGWRYGGCASRLTSPPSQNSGSRGWRQSRRPCSRDPIAAVCVRTQRALGPPGMTGAGVSALMAQIRRSAKPLWRPRPRRRAAGSARSSRG